MESSNSPGAFRARSSSDYAERPHDLVRLLIDAVDMATSAAELESQGRLALAADYYDKVLLSIDEVLSYLDPQSAQWKGLFVHRCKYDERLELLIAAIAQQGSRYYDFSLPMVPGGLGGMGGSQSSHSNSSSHSAGVKTAKLFSDFEQELLLQTPSNLPAGERTEKGPISGPADHPALAPFRLLRSIRRSVDTGAFLTDEVYVPKAMWSQSNVKFSGLSIKTNAFQSVMVLLSEQIATLQLTDKGMRSDSLNLACNAFKITRENLRLIQNQLSKPFSYIKEHAIQSETQVTGRKWTSLVSSFSKSMMKYAEVGYQRLGTIPTKISEDDLQAYAQLTSQLCLQCQLIEKWFIYVSGELGRPSCSRSSSSDRSAEEEDPSGAGGGVASAGGENNEKLNDLSTIYQEIIAISSIISESVCEIMLQDIEALLSSYLSKVGRRFNNTSYKEEDADDDNTFRNSISLDS